MQMLVWNILVFYIVITNASDVLGNHEDPIPGGSFTAYVRKSKATTFGELTRAYISDILEELRQRYPSTDPPLEPTTTTCATTTTEEPEITTTTEPIYITHNRSLMNDVVIPIIRDITNDEVALENVTTLFRVTVEALIPLATEVLKASNESFVPGENSVIKIPRAIVESTIAKLRAESFPLLKTIVRSRVRDVLLLLSYNTRILFHSILEMKYGNDSRFGDVMNKTWGLYTKYSELYWNSTAEYICTYSIVEMQYDIESLFSVLNPESQKRWRNNFALLQDISGINTDTITKMLYDIPGISDVIDAVPPQYYLHLLFLFL